MTQLQFEMICKIIESGAPALANELCNALNDLVVDRNNLAKQLNEIHESAERGDEKPNKPVKGGKVATTGESSDG